MAHGIIPLVDYAFKMLFGNEKHTPITIHFLNGVLVGQPPVKEITFQSPVRYRQTGDEKLCILDILAIDALGRQLNIEVQMSLPAGMAQKNGFLFSSNLGQAASRRSELRCLAACHQHLCFGGGPVPGTRTAAS